MKKLSFSFLAIMVVLFSFSCKKEISPDLEVTVVDSLDNPVRGAWVKTSVDGAEFGVISAEVIDSGRTDNFGKVFFEYENTILIDVGVYPSQDSRTAIDSSSILLETKRKSRNSSNTFEQKLVIR